MRTTHTTLISQNTERKLRPKKTQKLSHQVAYGWGPTFLPAWTVRLYICMPGFKSYPTTCRLNAPPLKPQFSWTKTDEHSTPLPQCGLHTQKTLVAEGWKPSLPRAGYMQPGSFKGLQNPEPSPTQYVLLRQRRALEPGDQQGPGTQSLQ